MGSRLGKRIIHFANLPIKLLMPSSLKNIREIGLKTIPSATKVVFPSSIIFPTFLFLILVFFFHDILFFGRLRSSGVLESLYGFEVEKVRTMNVEGKNKHSGGILLAKPDYKKAYVTLNYPVSQFKFVSNIIGDGGLEEQGAQTIQGSDC